MQISGFTGISNPLRNRSAIGGASQNEDMSKILADFVKEACKTPEERAKDEILKKHGLTQDDYNRLPKEQRDAIAKEIAEAVQRVAKQRLQKQADASAGGVIPSGGVTRRTFDLGA